MKKKSRSSTVSTKPTKTSRFGKKKNDTAGTLGTSGRKSNKNGRLSQKIDTQEGTNLRSKLRQEEASRVQKEMNSSFSVSFVNEDGSLITGEVAAGATGEEAIKQLLQEAQADGIDVGAVSDYILKVEGLDFFIRETHLPLHRVSLLQVCIKTFVIPRLQLVETTPAILRLAESQNRAQKDLQVAEVLLQHDLNDLIPDLAQYLRLENADTDAYRRKMTAERAKFTEELSSQIEDENKYMLHRYMDAEPLPPKVPAKIIVGFHMPTGQKMLKRVEATAKMSIEELISKCFKKFGQLCPSEARGRSDDEYILKVTGFQDFLYGPDELMRYDYVRRCISKDQDITLSLVETALIVEKYPKEKIAYESIVDKLLLLPQPAQPKKVVSVNKRTVAYKFKVKRVIGNESTEPPSIYFIKFSLYNGSQELCPAQFTKPVYDDGDGLVWEQVLFTSITIPNIPLGTRIQFSLWARKGSAESLGDPTSVDPAIDSMVGWVNFALFSADGFMTCGLQAINLWTPYQVKTDHGLKTMLGEPDPVGTCLHNVFAKNPVTLYVEFEPTSYHKNPRTRPMFQGRLPKVARSEVENAVITQLDAIIARDPLAELTDGEKNLIWDNRYVLTDDPKALTKFLLSVPWTQDKAVREAYDLTRNWAGPIEPAQALELVGPHYSDPNIRAVGVKAIDALADAEVLNYLPQLTQALKYELNHDSPLASMLIERAFRNRHRLGHTLFWALKAEMHLPTIAERYGLLLESYLRGAGTHRKELLVQNRVMESLINAALIIKTVPDKERLAVLRSTLGKINFPPAFQLPLDPRNEMRGLKIEKCRYMDSKKLPLWLEFENAEDLGDSIIIIFKEGDDLRQDQLTLQMLRIMDRLWKEQGLDLRMSPYGCVSTGDEIGMIEVVLNSDTMAGINRKAGGALKVFKPEVVRDWVIGNNNLNDASREKAKQNFTLSCAAYCVATYVLGIGDRHNDNIMICKTGTMFHIDFGHFLGNYKTKFGIKRERAPFVFTKQYAKVIGEQGSSEWSKFLRMCRTSYITLRRHSHLFINLFCMMLSTGIPELQCAADIEYLRDALRLDLSDEEAGSFIEDRVIESLNTKTTLLNDMVHILAH